MRWRILLPLFAVVCSVTAQTTPITSPTPPKVYPPETGRPKNMKYCRINSNTVFPWIVGIWDINFRQYVGHGSLITYTAFVTTCRLYIKREPKRYKGVGQFLWNISRPEDPCMQEKLIKTIYIHPKCLESPKMATFFDFAVFRMIYPFEITGFSYPTINFASSPTEMLTGAQYINIIHDTTGCMLPHFRNQNEQPPVFDFDSFVESIPFHTQCLPLLCEELPPNATFSTMCARRLGQRAWGTMLCMKNKNKRSVILGSIDEYWYAGTPLVCNGTSYGIATQLKSRKNFAPPNTDDIHFIVTFLRVWPWLLDLVRQHSAPWVRPIYIEDFSLVPEEFSTPSRVPIEDEGVEPRSGAAVFSPSIKSSIFTCFLCCFYPLSSIKYLKYS